MPNCNNGVHKVVYGKIFVNSRANTVTESTNWRADWLRLCGTSYANVVKRSTCKVACSNTHEYVKKVGNKSMTYTTRVRVRITPQRRSYQNSNHLYSMTNTSDVAKPLCKKHVNVNSLGIGCQSPIPIENRFNTLSHIDSNDIDQPLVLQSNSNNHIEQGIGQNSGTLTSEHMGKAVAKSLDVVEENIQKRYSNNGACISQTKRDNKRSKTNQDRKFILTETDDKYDLELRFRPRHR